MEEESQCLHTPPSSEQDEWEHAYTPYAMEDEQFDGEVQEVIEEHGVSGSPPVSPETPRKLQRTSCFGKKKPRTPLGISLWEETPDLAAYFGFFEGFDEAAQVKYCRAYANALSAKNPVANRMRYSAKKLRK